MALATESGTTTDESPKFTNKNKMPLSIRARPYLIFMPSLILTLGIMYPFISAIFYSFTNYTMGKAHFKYVGGLNWINAIADGDFWHALLVTGEYAFVTTSIEMLLGLGIALLLNYKSWFTSILKVVLVFPLMIAPVVATLIWQLMTNNSVGILEKFLNILGIFNFPWSSSPRTALFSVVIIDVWVYTAFIILLVLAGLQSFPKSPFESAKIDGGSAWFTFRTLTLPMLKPFMYIALIFRLMAAMQEFAIIFALTKGGPGNTLMNLSLTAYLDGFGYMRFGGSLPYVLVLWLIIFLISNRLVGNWIKAQKAAASN
jgi:multiple sugar transport system permease protein